METVSGVLISTKPEDDIERYNKTVQEFYSLQAKIRSSEQKEKQLESQLLILDKEIVGYVNDLKVFKKEFLEAATRMQGASDQVSEQENFFLTRIQEYIQDMEHDFTGHVVQATKYQQGHFVVNAILNDSVTATLMVDTGASSIFISKKIADKLGIAIKKDGPAAYSMLADGRKIRIFPFLLKSVKVGDAEVKNVAASVALQEEGVSDIDGLLGMSFLKHFKVRMQPDGLVFDEFNP